MFREDLSKQIRAMLYFKYSTKSIMSIVLNLAGRKYLLGNKTCTSLNQSVASEPTNRHSYSNINCKEENHSTALGNLVSNKVFVKKYLLQHDPSPPVSELTSVIGSLRVQTISQYLIQLSLTLQWPLKLYKVSNSTNSTVASLLATCMDDSPSLPPDPGNPIDT